MRELQKTQQLVLDDAQTVAKVIVALDNGYLGMGERLIESGGKLLHWVHIFVIGEDLCAQDGLHTWLATGVEDYVVPSVVGGAENS